MNEPTVSVVSIAYNHDRYIEQAVRSVLGQATDFGVEFLIGEDCSTDNTRSILEHLVAADPDRLTVLFRDRNWGAMRNFCDTYNAARGEFVALIEGDDYWSDCRKLQKQVEALRSHPEWSGCFHPTHYVNSKGVPTGYVHPPEHHSEVTFEELCHVNSIHTCSLMLRRSALPRLADWMTQLNLGDWPMCLLASQKGPIGMLADCMSCHRLHATGIWSAARSKHRHQSVLEMFLTVQEHVRPELRPHVAAGRETQIARLLTRVETLESSVSFKLGSAITLPLRAVYERMMRKPS